MLFKPYHNFANCSKLEKIVNDFSKGDSITDEVFSNFHRYHPAMIHKLRSAKHYLDLLNDKLASTDIHEAAVATGDFHFEINMFIDGYFYNSGSALDILSRVVLTMFGEALTGRIYFQTAHAKLSVSRLGDTILPRLEDPAWRDEFRDYRNTLTHELIIATKYQIDVDHSGAKPIHQIIFPLSDDPRAEPQARTYRNNPNVAEYTKTNFRRILSIANIIYGDIVNRADASGSLPI